MSGKETEEMFLYQFNERRITHLVMVEQTQTGYTLRVGLFNKLTLIDEETPVSLYHH